MNLRPGLLVLTAFLLPILTASAATLTFNDASDYDDNFWESWNGSSVTWNSAGYLVKTGNGSLGNSVAIYNTHASGGSGGSGGTAGGVPLDKFGDFTLKIDFSTNGLNLGHSVGFYTKVNDASTAGYFAVFRITSATTADFRVFESNSNPSAGSVGAQIGSTLAFTTSGSFAINTFYTFQLEVLDTGGNVQFTGSLFNAGGGSQIGISRSITDTTAAVTGPGQIGLRVASDSTGGIVRIDNLSIIPEPSVLATFCLGISGLFLLGNRRRLAMAGRSLHRKS